MASIIKEKKKKSQANGSAISIASGGAVTVNNGITDAGTISAGSIGSAVTMSANQACVKTALNATGSAPIYACRARWAPDPETETAYGLQNLSHSASSSVHTWTFTTSAPSTNYTVVATAYRSGGYNEVSTVTSKATGNFTCTASNTGGVLTSYGQNVAVFY